MDEQTTGINVPLLAKVFDHISAHLDEWEQEDWWCGTKGCVAGWAVHLGSDLQVHPGGDHEVITLSSGVESDHVCETAADLLGLKGEQIGRLFSGGNRLRQLYVLANRYTNGEIEIPATLPDGS